MKPLKHKKIKAIDFDAAFEKSNVVEHLDLKTIQVCYPAKSFSNGLSKDISAGVLRKKLKRAK